MTYPNDTRTLPHGRRTTPWPRTFCSNCGKSVAITGGGNYIYHYGQDKEYCSNTGKKVLH